MKCWTLVAAVAMIAVLTACSNSNEPTVANESVRTVPTSPNAAYQTVFPVEGATNETILEGRLPGSELVADQPGGGGTVESPTPDAAPVVTETVFEEETPSPATIDPREAATETGEPDETTTAIADEDETPTTAVQTSRNATATPRRR